MDFKSNALTTRPSQLAIENRHLAATYTNIQHFSLSPTFTIQKFVKKSKSMATTTVNAAKVAEGDKLIAEAEKW